MTEAQNLVVKYLKIVGGYDDEFMDKHLRFGTQHWSGEQSFQTDIQTAIKCAISETEAILGELGYRGITSRTHENILNELKQMQ